MTTSFVSWQIGSELVFPPTNSTRFVSASAFGYWEGSLSEFCIWSTARTLAQIQSTQAVRLVGNEAGLVSYLCACFSSQ